MAEAKKCDRCGAYYDKCNIPSVGRVHNGRLGYLQTYTIDHSVDKCFDLCNNCWVDFLDNFMKKTEKDE